MNIRHLITTGLLGLALVPFLVSCKASSDDPAPAAEPLMINTASGTPMDVVGMTWRRCEPGTTTGTSVRYMFTFTAADTFAYSEDTFTTTGCVGASTNVKTATVTLTPQGDKTSRTWEGGSPPAGTTLANSVTATGVILVTDVNPACVPPDGCKTLYFIDDGVVPQMLYEG